MGFKTSRVAASHRSVGGAYPLSLKYHGAFVCVLGLLATSLSQLKFGSNVLPIQDFTHIHILLEMTMVILAMSACFTIWSAPVEYEFGPTLVLAAALFMAACLNFLHAMTMPPMPEFISAAISHRSQVFSLAARSLLAGALLALSISSRFRTTTTIQRRSIVSVYIVSTLTAGALLVGGDPSPIPILKFELEWVFAAALGIAAFRFALKSKGTTTKFFPFLFAAAATSSIGQFVFAGGDGSPTINNMTRHLVSVIAYWWLYRAIFEVGVRYPFLRLNEQTKVLQQSNSTMHFQALALESASASIMLMDSDGKVTWQNKASLEFQRRRNANTGSLSQVLSEPVEITPKICEVLAKTSVWKGGYQERDAKGSLRYFDKSITSVRNSEGVLEGYVSVADDITDTIKGELRYKRLLETAQDGFAIIDINGQYIEVNDSFARMVGYSREELLTMNAQALFVNSPVAQWLAKVKAEKVTTHQRYNATITKKNGETVHVQSSVTFEVEEQQFFAFIHDSTVEEQANAAQRDLENQLLHAQKVHALGALTSGIAHDFNNILASILGYSNLALERFVPDKESKLAKYLNEVVSASERARDLISKMLIFTRSKPNSSVSDIHPAVAIGDVVAMLRPSIPANIGIKVASGAQVTVCVEAGELNQMLVNLIINARDSIASHGEITLGWERIDATGLTCAFSRQRLTGEFVSIFVSDTGSGIELETLLHIFDPYFTTKDVGKGSGLGLPMVQGIMLRAGGHVLVDSTLEKGTTFRLLFPVTSSTNLPKADDTAPAALPDKGSGQRIWVIDDEAPIGRYMNELLSEWGYEVRTFQDPLEAWAAFESAPAHVDLVISDQTMHGMTGTELIEKMHELVPNLPVVMCSGHVEEVTVEERKNFRLFRKPVDAQEFLRTVYELLSEKLALVDRR